jgi:hypothetical protein
MKKVILKCGTVALLTATVLTSCKKSGCTDKDATNYDEKAKKDDATCTFEGQTVIWFNKSVADSLIADGSTSITYNVDGAVAGSSATNVYWTGAPKCDQSGSVTIKKSLGKEKTKTYPYSFKDQTGAEVWKGTLKFEANTCTALELTN